MKNEHKMNLIFDSFDELNDDHELITNFNMSFPELPNVTSKEQIIAAVGMSLAFREWFLNYKKMRSVVHSKPNWLPDSQEGVKEWASLTDALQKHNKKLIYWEKARANITDDVRRKLAGIEREKRAYYENLDPVIVIDSLTVENLPKSEIVKLALIGDLGERNAEQLRLVEELKERTYIDWKATGVFQNPFCF